LYQVSGTKYKVGIRIRTRILPTVGRLGLFQHYLHSISTNKKAPYRYGAFALFLGDIGYQVNYLVGVAPLVVVPGNYLYEGVG